MGKEQFIKKYKGKQFIVEMAGNKNLSTHVVLVDDQVLDEEEEDLFFIFYQEMKTIYESKSIEIVKWD